MAEDEADWNLYRTFLAVVRGGSLSAAARVLGSTQPTIGRQIEALEAALDARLFTRSQRGLLPTAAAMELAGAIFSGSGWLQSLRASLHIYSDHGPQRR